MQRIARRVGRVGAEPCGGTGGQVDESRPARPKVEEVSPVSAILEILHSLSLFPAVLLSLSSPPLPVQAKRTTNAMYEQYDTLRKGSESSWRSSIVSCAACSRNPGLERGSGHAVQKGIRERRMYSTLLHLHSTNRARERDERERQRERIVARCGSCVGSG
jgi:hypothetical protein